MKKRYIILSLFLLFSISIGFFLSDDVSPAYGAIPVIDTANIAETHANYLQALQTAINTAKQIEYQLKELQGLSEGFLNAFKNDFNQDLQNIQQIQSQAQGMAKASQTAEQAWNNTFYTAEDYGNSNVVDRLKLDKNVIHALDLTYKDAFNLIKQTGALDKEIENLNRAMEANTAVEGNKQALQIQNVLSGQLVELRAKELAVKNAEAIATVAYYQRENQIEAAAADIAKRHVEALEAYKKK